MKHTPPGALPLPVVPGLTDLEVFARGGYATVYRAVQQSVGREVAVKVENRTLDSERDQARFLREARAAGRMSSHPHVVDLFDVGVTVDQHPYLIMELCDGSYAERMRQSPLGPAEALDLGIKIADALAHSHAAGVLHRDVKPANILHSHFNPAVLADFGLAVLAEVRDSSVTLEVLTPAYAPPEMFRHSPPSPAVDVYALCATLYAVMQGKPPRWQEDRNPSLVALLDLFTQPIPDLPGVPSGLLDLLRHGMANDPADRPSAERLRDLLAAVSLNPAPARPVSPAGTGAFGSAMPVAGVVGSASPSSAVPISGAPISAVPISGAPIPGASISGGAPPTVYLSSSYAPPALRSPLAPGVPFEDEHPTVPTSDGRRRLPWIFGGVGALVLLLAAMVGVWYITDRGVTDVSPTGIAQSPVAMSPPSAPIGQGGALPGCLSALPGVAHCPVDLECFGPVRVRGATAQATQVSCAGRHTWESYAEGLLPVEVDAADHRAVKADSTVAEVCAPNIFRLTTGLPAGDDWKFEVLPPAADGTEPSERTFRCLAGRGVNALNGPVLTR